MTTKIMPAHLPRFTVVKLEDGRMGYLENLTREPFVCVKDQDNVLLGVQVGRYEPLEVIRYPAQLAREFVESQPLPRPEGKKETYVSDGLQYELAWGHEGTVRFSTMTLTGTVLCSGLIGGEYAHLRDALPEILEITGMSMEAIGNDADSA